MIIMAISRAICSRVCPSGTATEPTVVGIGM